MRGHAIPISVPKRLIIDLLYFARDVPSIPVQKQMCLASLIEARRACSKKPRWTVILAKAYALVAEEFPELRRAYVKLPFPQLYEYPASVANIVIEREYNGERCLFGIKVNDPAHRSLYELGEMLEISLSRPIGELKDIRTALQIASLPRPIRRALWWLGLNVGRERARFFGTFGLSVYSALNCESLHPRMPIATLLNYGVLDKEGKLHVRIIYDHRVLNGTTIARALTRLEQILVTTLVEEIKSMAQAPFEKAAA